jgi:biopolymer transport protein ExbB
MRNKTRSILTLFLLLWCAALVAPLCAQEDAATPAASPPPPAAVEKSLVDLFYAGGALMWPILLCSVGTIAVGVYCFLQINQKKMMPKAQEAAVSQFMQHQDPNGAYQLCQASPNVFANTMSAALLKVNFERDLANKSSMEQAAGETLMQEEQRLMIWVNYLNIFATIAPMLGLLGTVTGMIASFDQLAAGRSEPSDLAGGIGEAMLTTAGGLIVGIPAMFLFFYFRNLLQVAIGNIQKSVTFMIDVLSGELKLEAGLHAHDVAPDESGAA